jgi:nitrate/nitrite transporter NarK
MYGFSVLPNLKGAALIAVGIIGVLIFALYEMRISSPVLDISLLTKKRIFALANLSALINYSATFAVTFLLSLDLQYIKGFKLEYAGIILVVQPVVQAMILPIAGKLSDRVESRIVASVGMALTAIGLFGLIFLTEETSLSVPCFHSTRARCRFWTLLVP